MYKDKKNIFAAVPLRGAVLFPGITMHFDIGRLSSLRTVENAISKGEDVLFITQKEASVEKPTQKDFYPIGVVGSVKQIIKLVEDEPAIRIIAEGKYRVALKSFVQQKLFFVVEVNRIDDDYTMPADFSGTLQLLQEASIFSLKKYFYEYASHIPQLTPEILIKIYDNKQLGKTVDYMAGNIILSMDDKYKLLSTFNVFERSELLCSILAKETHILEMDEQLQNRVQEKIDKNQKEYRLREELKVITEELNEIDGEDTTGLLAKINAAPLTQEAREKLLAEFERMNRLSSFSSDSNVLRAYIEKCLELPWGKYTKENSSLKKAVKILEKDHYGLKNVKERITEMIAAIMVSPAIRGQIICLAGPPGVGKTSVAKSIARATGRNYVRISLGGTRDEAEIRGHRKTYIGAMPGRIINALIEAKSMNALILLDEIDKLGGDFRGDPAAALLEVLDGEQNCSFRDHYIEMPVDLSKILFITTANDINAIPCALRDRMEVIELPSYTYEEKFNIAKKHLIPKQLKEHSLTKSDIKISNAALRAVIDGYTKEAGVRILERQIASLCRKAAVRLASGNTERLDITENNLEEYLGVRKYRPEEIKHDNEIGVVNGLAWTATGGEMLQAEVAALDGTGKIELTGSLGDVMKESVKTAVSYVRSRAELFNIDKDFYKTKDIHVHFPEGATPKDGPSAGVTVATALVSALTNRKVRGNIAMTGEITLTGRLLAIGGLREKATAAYTQGIDAVIIPKANVPDISEVDEAVKEKLEFIPLKNADDVIALALLESEEKKIIRSEKPKKDMVVPAVNSVDGIVISCKNGICR